MYIVFLYIYSAPQNVNGSSTEMTTASERKGKKKKMMVLFFDYSQVGNWLYITTYNMTTAIILWQRLLWK